MNARAEQLAADDLYFGEATYWFGSVLVANPAAGAELSVKIPGGTFERWYALYFDLTTDATVANRNIELRLQDQDGATLWRTVDSGVQAASVTQGYTWESRQTQELNSASAPRNLTLPAFPLLPTWQFVTVTGQRQAGDQFKNVRVVKRTMSTDRASDPEYAWLAARYFA